MSDEVREFKQVLASSRLEIDSIHVNRSETRALVVSTEANLREPDAGDRKSGYLAITLEKQNGNWGITDSDFETRTSAQMEVLRFLKADE